MAKLAGSIVFLAGMYSVYLGSWNDAQYLDSVVQRMFFFACASVLIVAGWKHKQLRSLPLAARLIVVLLALTVTGLAMLCAVSFGFFSAAVMLAAVAVGHRFATRAPLPLISSAILAAFAGYVLTRVMTRGYWDWQHVLMPGLALILSGAAAYFSHGFSRSSVGASASNKG